MSPRRGFGDEIWRLAQAGDSAGLERVSHLLADDCELALSALQLEIRSASHSPGASELAAACVRRDPHTWRRGLRLALAAEAGVPGKLRAAAAIWRARLGGRQEGPEALPDPSP